MLLRLRPLLFPSVTASSAGKGSVIRIGEKYYDVEKCESKHVARQAGFVKMDATEILTGKKEHMQLSANGRVDRVDLEKVSTQVQYVDKPAGVLVVADTDFNPIEVPLVYCQGFQNVLEAGDQVALMKDSENGNLVKCSFSVAVINKQRLAKK